MTQAAVRTDQGSLNGLRLCCLRQELLLDEIACRLATLAAASTFVERRFLGQGRHADLIIIKA